MPGRTTGHRKRAISNLMLNFGMIGARVEETLELHFHQCSLLVTCHDLAVMGALGWSLRVAATRMKLAARTTPLTSPRARSISDTHCFFDSQKLECPQNRMR